MTRGWKGNALGLQKFEVMDAHQARLDATEAVAQLMRQGKTFPEAKAEIERRAGSVYRFRRPEHYQGTMALVRDVQFGDMPPDIVGKVEKNFLAMIEKARGYEAGWIERAWFKLSGHTF
jgi:hypothetical protein